MSYSIGTSFGGAVDYVANCFKSAASQVGSLVTCGLTDNEEITSQVRAFALKAFEIGKKALLIIASIAFIVANPGIFTLSFMVAFVFDEPVRTVIERINQRVFAQSWPILIAFGCAATFSLPVSVAVLSSICAMHWGCYFSNQAAIELESQRNA